MTRTRRPLAFATLAAAALLAAAAASPLAAQPSPATAWPATAWPATSGSTAPADPSQDGATFVRVQTVWSLLPSGEAIPFTVHLPAAGSFARPVVLVIHGYSAVGMDYSWIADHLASRGFAAALVETRTPFEPDFETWATETLAALDALELANADVWSGLWGELDFSHVAAVGHSYGGSTAIAAAARDSRIKAVAALEPGADGAYHRDLLARASQVKVPLLVVGGELDPICPPAAQGLPAFQAATSAPARLYVEVRGADHLGLLDLAFDPFVLANGQWKLEYLPFPQLHQVASRYFTSWVETMALGAPDPAGYTDGRFAAKDVAAGTLTRFAR